MGKIKQGSDDIMTQVIEPTRIYGRKVMTPIYW